MRELWIEMHGCSASRATSLVVAALAVALAFPIVLLATEAAHADCTPAAGSNLTATCTGTTVNQGGGASSGAGIDGYGTGTQTNITVNVASGAGTSVTGTNDGIAIGNGTVINQIGASIAGGLSGVAAASDINVTNAGSIQGTTSIGIFAGANGTVTNNSGAVVTGGQFGIMTNTGSAGVTNSGSIVGSSVHGIFARINATVINNVGGSITGAINGIEAGNGFVEFTNAGSIAANSSAAIFAFTDVIGANNVGAHITGVQYGIFANGTAILVNSGSISGGSLDGIFSGINATVTNNTGSSIAGGRYGIFAFGGGSSIFNAGTISGGTAAIRLGGAGNTLTLGPGSVIVGNVFGTGSDTFQLGGSGAGSFDASQIGAAAQYQGFGTFNKIGSSTWTLTGTSTFAGPVSVYGGTLAVNGDISSASGVTVNAGGILSGNGTVGDTTISGGTLSPGIGIGALTVQGSLLFTAASSYMVELSQASADSTNVVGTATLGNATVSAILLGGNLAKQYRILNATGGVIGTFDPVVNTRIPNVNASLSYDAHDVFLNFALNFGGGLNINQQNVGNALTNFFNGTGNIPLVFASLTPAALTQVSGETATGSQQTTFDAMNLFMSVLMDPFIAGRRESGPPQAPAIAYSDENAVPDAHGKTRTSGERDAYAAAYLKAPPAALNEPRWSVWAAGFGGSQSTSGSTLLGSNDTTSRIAAGAVGADYRFSPDTIAGFALAGGGTSFSVANGGTGRSDLFQAGAFVRHTIGPAYIAAAAAYGWQDITTDRTVTAAGLDQLRAHFDASAYSGRVEAGYRFTAPWTGEIGITPYAAGQFTTFDLPAYAESAVVGSNTFALGYDAKSVTASRSELGFRSDKSFAMLDGVFTLRGRAAWAHDFNPDRNIQATFQTLPGASFVVNGATQAHDATLATASAEWKWRNGWSAAGIFEGEFSTVTRSYAGKGLVRYAW